MVSYNKEKMNKKIYGFIFIFCVLIATVIFYVTQSQKSKEFPIDLVYLWVDGNDENWFAKKKYWLKKTGATNTYSTTSARWRDNGELKYSLRSIAKYMPWINKIYIVTDNQIPSWLNTNHPKIKIIDHKEILPADALPLFNSMAIETGIANIPNLSEHFIYANDDVFANKPLPREYFFTTDGTPIYYYDKKMRKFYDEYYEKMKKKNDIWYHIVKNERDTIKNKLGDISVAEKFADTHTFTSYKKSIYNDAMNFFADELRPTVYSKFRADTNISRDVVFYYIWKNDNIVMKNALNVKPYNCNISGLLIYSKIQNIKNQNPCSFCLNDYDGISENELQSRNVILQKMFPNKSEFEK